jgi:acylphosphatase
MVNSSASSGLFSIRIIVRGRVQGVSFRAFVSEKARQLGIRGFVRNLPSFNDVEVQAEGDKENLDKLLVYLKQGPEQAKVDNISSVWAKHENRFKSFKIEY